MTHTHRQTDEQTDDLQDRASIAASRGKNTAGEIMVSNICIRCVLLDKRLVFDKNVRATIENSYIIDHRTNVFCR